MTRSAPSAQQKGKKELLASMTVRYCLCIPWAAPLRELYGGGEDDDALSAQRAQQRQRHQRLIRARAHHLVLAQLPRQRIPGPTALLSYEQQHKHHKLHSEAHPL